MERKKLAIAASGILLLGGAALYGEKNVTNGNNVSNQVNVTDDCSLENYFKQGSLNEFEKNKRKKT